MAGERSGAYRRHALVRDDGAAAARRRQPPEPAFAGVVDELHIDGCRLDETVLVHRAARTLVVADLVHNVGRPEGAWARTYTRAMGFSDRAAARRSLDAILAQPFERLVVGHGAPLAAGAREALAAAYAWLS